MHRYVESASKDCTFYAQKEKKTERSGNVSPDGKSVITSDQGNLCVSKRNIRICGMTISFTPFLAETKRCPAWLFFHMISPRESALKKH